MKKIFVIEGTDGSGKQTQTQKIYERLINSGKEVLKTSFPNYNNQSSGPIKEYLSGNISKNPNEISSKAASCLYAVDRYITYKENIEKYYNDDKTIILFDRYVSSNLLHQGGKLITKKVDYNALNDFSNWLNKLEFEDLCLPKPSIVFFLHMPVEFSISLMKERENKFSNTMAKDIHELNFEHLKNAEIAGLYYAKKLGWKVINCIENNKLRSIESNNDQIYSGIAQKIKK